MRRSSFKISFRSSAESSGEYQWYHLRVLFIDVVSLAIVLFRGIGADSWNLALGFVDKSL